MFQTANLYQHRINYSTPHKNSIYANKNLDSLSQSKWQNAHQKNIRTNIIRTFKHTQAIMQPLQISKPSTTEIRKSDDGEYEPGLNINYQTAKQHNNRQFYLDWKQRNSNRLRFSNNVIKDKAEKNYHFSSQKQKAENQEKNGMDEHKNNIFRVQNRKTTTIIQSTHKAANSLNVGSAFDNSITSLDANLGTQPNRYARGPDRFRDKVNFSTNLLSKEKVYPYIQKNRADLFGEKKQGEKKSELFTHSAFDRTQNREQQSERIQIFNISPALVHRKLANLTEPEYFAQSFKGRRPYNQDRYICETKYNSLKQKLNRLVSNQVRSQSHQQNQGAKNSGNKNWFFGVFDGHGGSKCAQYLKQNFYSMLCAHRSLFINPDISLRDTFNKLQEKFLSICQKGSNLETSGSCAVVCMLGQSKFYIGNVGDSRALLLGVNNFKQVTNDHKPDDPNEKQRIIRNGGKLYKDGSVMGAAGKQNIKIFNQTRILPGSLNVSRTIGDIEVKVKKFGGSPGIVVHEPEIYVQNLDSQFQHLILASDGLFEGLSNKQIYQIYKGERKKEKQNFVNGFVKQIIRKSGQSSNDNITVICIRLPKGIQS